MEIHLSGKARRTLNARGRVSGAELVYLVSAIPAGTAGEEIMLAAVDQSPKNLGFAVRSGARIVGRPASGACEVEIAYAPLKWKTDDDTQIVKRAGDEVWSFSADTRREHRFTALSTRSFPGSDGATAPDPGNWINWNGISGGGFRALGCGVRVPEIREKCIRTFHPDRLSITYKRRVSELVGKVNNASFHHWEAGEVLLVGIEQSREFRNERGEWLTDVTFEFSISPNRGRVQLPGGMTATNVKGHEVLWVLPGSSFSNFNAVFAGAYAATVYESGDFSQLEIARGDAASALRQRLQENRVENRDEEQ